MCCELIFNAVTPSTAALMMTPMMMMMKEEKRKNKTKREKGKGGGKAEGKGKQRRREEAKKGERRCRREGIEGLEDL